MTYSLRIGFAVAVLTLSDADLAAAASSPGQVCAARKQRAAARCTSAKLNCYATAIKAGTAVKPDCLQKADQRLATAFQRAENRGGCAIVGNAALISAQVDGYVAAVVGALPALAPTPTASHTATPTPVPSATLPPPATPSPTDPPPPTVAETPGPTMTHTAAQCTPVVCPGGPGACPNTTLWVSETAQSGGSDLDCTTAGYSSLQAAVDAAAAANIIAPGTVTGINVCPGIYAENVLINTPGLTIRGVGDGPAVLRPNSPRLGALIRDVGGEIVAHYPIVQVSPFAPNTVLTRLVVDGRELSVNPTVGIYFEHGNTGYCNPSGTVDDVFIADVVTGVGVNSTISGPVGKLNVTVRNSTIVGHGAGGGVVCTGGDSVVCTVTNNTIIAAPNPTAQTVGVGLLLGASGTVSNNRIRGNSSTVGSAPQPQAEFGTGIMLFAAGVEIDCSSSSCRSEPVKRSFVTGNVLLDNGIGVQVVDSIATVSGNSIGFVDPLGVGVYAVGCSKSCNETYHMVPRTLAISAPADQPVTVSENRIVTPPDSHGIWLGDDWSPGAEWSELVTLYANRLSAGSLTTIDAGAHE